MAQVINTNALSLMAQNNLNKSQSSLGTAIQRLSSGLRINSAKDDAAGLAISNRFTSTIRGLTQAARNANDGISLAQTTEGALTEVTENLQRIRELTVQAKSDTNSEDDRASIKKEITARLEEIQRISDTTNFNGVNVLDGSRQSLTIQIGDKDGQTIDIDLTQMDLKTLGLENFDMEFSTITVTMGKDQVEVPRVAGQGTVVAAGADVSIEGQTDPWKTTDAERDKVAAAIDGTYDKDDIAIYTIGSGADQKLYAKVIKTGVPDENEIFEFSGDFTSNTGALEIGNIQVEDKLTALEKDIFTNGASTLNVTAATITDGLTTITNDNGDDVNLSEEQMNEIASLFSADATAAGLQMEIFSEGNEHYAVDKDGNIKKFSLDNTDNNKVVEDTTAISAVDQNKILQSWSATAAPGYPHPADKLLTKLDDAMTKVTNFTADLGAIQNRFGSIIANLNTTVINTSEARSRVLDADFSVEVSAMSRANILQSAGVSVLAQANQVPNNVLQLLR
ncbi:flagellin [Enterobacter cloacae]